MGPVGTGLIPEEILPYILTKFGLEFSESILTGTLLSFRDTVAIHVRPQFLRKLRS